MNAAQFTSLLEKPSPISEMETAELGKLVKQFPYFQSAHLLYLKGLHQNKSIEYSKQLKITAAYANDRKKLYELIIKEDLHDQIQLVEEYSSKETAAKTDVSPLEAQILQEAVSASIKLEVTPHRELDIDPDESRDEDLPGNATIKTKPILHEDVPAEKKKTVSVDSSTNRTFNQWLRTSEEPFIEADSSIVTSEEEPNLIDKFIGAAPRIGNAKSAAAESSRQPFFSPVDTARLSLVDDPSFVTETLARIYEAQGYLEKAKNAYTLLVLKYPQKKATFAARIKELEARITRQK